VNQPANALLGSFRDAVYHRHKVDPALKLPADELAETRAVRFADLKAAEPDAGEDTELIRHWAVADLLAANETTGAGHDRIRRIILVNAVRHPHYAATIGAHSPELLRGSEHPDLIAPVGTAANTSAIDGRLAALGYRMEASLSSLDSEDDGHALVDLVTLDLVDPPNEQVRELMEAWTAEIEAHAAPGRALKTIADNHARLLRSRDGVVPKEALREMAAEDADALRALTSPDQRQVAVTTMAASASAHPGYAEGLVSIDARLAQEVADADAARKRTEAEYLLVQVERRREFIDDADSAGLTAAAHADADALMRIGTEDERLLALIVVGSRAQKLPGYAAALADVNQSLADAAVAARAHVQGAVRGDPLGAAAAPEADGGRESAADAPPDHLIPDGHPLLKEVEQRALQLQLGEIEPSRLADTARLDVDAVLRIPGEQDSARALESLGWSTAFNADYERALKQHAPEVARLAEALQGLVLDSAYGDSRSADSAGERAAIMAELRALQEGPATAEAAAMAAIRSRHAARRDAGAPIEAIDSAEIARLAQADAADLMAIQSTAGMREIALDLSDCLSNPSYTTALEAADFRTGAALRQLEGDRQFRELLERRHAEAERKRGLFGVLVEEGEAPDKHDEAQRRTYYVKYLEDSGRVGTAWGRELPAALRLAGAAIGDRVRIVRGPSELGTESDLACDRSRFTIEVLERAQLVDAGTPSPVEADAAADSERDPRDDDSAADRAEPARAPADVAPPSAAASVASATSSQTAAPVIDDQTLARLAARRRQDSAAARASLGPREGEDEWKVPSAASSSARPTATESASPAANSSTGTPPKTPSPAAPQKPRPANPMANGVTGEPAGDRPTPSETIAKLLEGITYEIKSNGSVLYLVRGKAAFVDHGQQILMHDAGNEEDDAILAAVLLAKEKWGKVELTGTQAFKQRALELLVKHNIDVQLKNPEQDAIRRQLMAAAPVPAAGDAPKPLVGQPRQGDASSTSEATTAAKSTPSSPAPVQHIRVGDPQSSEAPASPVISAEGSPKASQSAAPVLAADLVPIRARDWWSTQHAAILYWSKGRSAMQEADLAQLGPEPPPDQVFWFDKGGRRCDPPSDAKAFAESLAAADANGKEMNMADRKGDSADQLVLRGLIKDGDEFRTTALLFKGKGDFLQGFIEAGGVKHQVIVHINKRKPDDDGVVRPNFLKVAELTGSGEPAQWKEIGYGNAVNHRSDGKVVHFDEVLFNVGQEVVKARVTAKVDADMHRNLGFMEPRRDRNAANRQAATQETSGPKAAPAARVPEDAAAEAPVTRSRRNSRARAAA